MIGGTQSAAIRFRHLKSSGGFGLFKYLEIGGAEGAAERGLFGVVVLRADGGEEGDEAGAPKASARPIPREGGEGSGAPDEAEKAREAVELKDATAVATSHRPFFKLLGSYTA